MTLLQSMSNKNDWKKLKFLRKHWKYRPIHGDKALYLIKAHKESINSAEGLHFEIGEHVDIHLFRQSFGECEGDPVCFYRMSASISDNGGCDCNED